MKRRISNVLNFFAFNLLFFALYLNFVHKDSNTVPVTNTPTHSAVPTTVVSENAAPYNHKIVIGNAEAKQTSSLHDKGAPLRLSFN
jgi:hypothetical protein